jgi:hypothetical protein
MIDFSMLLKVYETAWNETDAKRRLALLEKCWAEAGVYTDPGVQTRSRVALSDNIGAFLASTPGHALRVVSGADEHHGQVRFEWRLVDDQRAVAIAGMSYGLIGEGGLIERMTGFFGPFPSGNECEADHGQRD